MNFVNTETLGGTGSVLFGESSYNALDTPYSGGATLTIGSGITIHGGAGYLGDDYYNYAAASSSLSSIINQGTIAADSDVDSGNYGYDSGFTGGYANSTSTTIDTSGVVNPAPQYVYQTERYGYSFSYALAGLTPGGSYTVRLHFADFLYSNAGDNSFDVSLNGTKVLPGFDIIAAAGGKDKAVVEQFTTTADSGGTITASFAGTGGYEYAEINGIEVLSGSTDVLTVDCGQTTGAGITINPNVFTNQGTMSASNGDTLSIEGAWSNAATGKITATNATLDLGDQYSSSTSAWSNAGTITGTNSTINLGGVFTQTSAGSVTQTGSTINLVGTLNNTGSTLALNGSTGSWNLDGGTVMGGSYSASGGASLVFTTSGGTLDGVTANSDLNLNQTYGAYAAVLDGLTLAGTTIRLGDVTGSDYGYLNFNNTETLGGTGTVLFGESSYNGLNSESSGSATLTIGSGITIHGGSGYLGDNYYYYGSSGTIINQGTIAADGSVGSGDYGITLNPTTFTNQGTVSASNGQTLTINGAWSNAAAGTITATNATLNLGDQSSSSTNAWSNAGTITGTNSTINLGGVFTQTSEGSLTQTGGSINLVGTLDNSGSTLALNAATGSWNLVGGTVEGGSYSASGGASLVFTSSGGTLDGVTANSNLDLSEVYGASVTIKDGLTLNNTTVLLGNESGSTYGYLYTNGTQTLGGTGTVLFGGSSSNTLYAASGGNATLTIGSGITIHGTAGSLRDYYTSTIINQGTIAADDALANGDIRIRHWVQQRQRHVFRLGPDRHQRRDEPGTGVGLPELPLQLPEYRPARVHAGRPDAGQQLHGASALRRDVLHQRGQRRLRCPAQRHHGAVGFRHLRRRGCQGQGGG